MLLDADMRWLIPLLLALGTVMLAGAFFGNLAYQKRKNDAQRNDAIESGEKKA